MPPFTTPDAKAGGRNGAVVYEATCNCSFSHNYPYACGPRLGAAYQIDSKTVLRGGAGIQYDAQEAPNGIVYSTADYYQLTRSPTASARSRAPADLLVATRSRPATPTAITRTLSSGRTSTTANTRSYQWWRLYAAVAVHFLRPA